MVTQVSPFLGLVSSGIKMAICDGDSRGRHDNSDCLASAGAVSREGGKRQFDSFGRFAVFL